MNPPIPYRFKVGPQGKQSVHTTDSKDQMPDMAKGVHGNRLTCGEFIGRSDAHVSDRDAMMQLRLLHAGMTSEPMLKDKPRLVSDWDYRTANTKEYTHGIHPYPAMMIPQVARRLIQEYGYPRGILFDPYCGTGTTLLEAYLVGSESVGTDLNPLARLIAKVKTTQIDINQLDLALERFVEFGFDAVPSSNGRVETPDIPNVDYWFDGRVQRELTLIREYIDLIDDMPIADFFRIAFSLTIRKTSWTKNSEFKLVRIPPERMKDHNPDVFSTMVNILTCNRDAVFQLNNALDQSVPLPSIYGFNSVAGVPRNVIDRDCVDLIVTSPPYGDSRTTVAYGQFSRLSSQWMGYKNANRIDNELMGGSKFQGDVFFDYEALDSAIRIIADTNPKRSREVASFFIDYRKSIMNVSSVVKPGGYACYVVGNRTVNGMEIPTAEATAAFFEMNGFTHIDTFRRNIPNKRMPSMNSPTNVPGKLGSTMKTEHIVICQRNMPR